MYAKKLVRLAVVSGVTAGCALFASPASAFVHEGAHYGRHGQRGGCFVTTSPAHNTKGIRHWRSPCPHHERKHLNPYHPGYHRPHHPHPAPH
jgi:hypothetical protein